MKVVINRVGLRQILQWLQRALFAAAILLFAWSAYLVVDAWAFQQREGRELDILFATYPSVANLHAQATANAPPSKWPETLDNGVIGRLDISRLELSAIVVEGTSSTAMRRAVGHISGTALPGEPGNVGISGHRDTFFRPLRHVQRDDLITVTTLRGEFNYRVVSIQIVTPTDMYVLEPGTGEILTLVTCYPFYFVGSAPERFIVRAQRVS